MRANRSGEVRCHSSNEIGRGYIPGSKEDLLGHCIEKKGTRDVDGHLPVGWWLAQTHANFHSKMHKRGAHTKCSTKCLNSKVLLGSKTTCVGRG